MYIYQRVIPPKTLSSAAVEMEKNDVKSVHCTLGEKKRFHFGMRWKPFFRKPLFSLRDISMMYATPTSTRF